MVGPDSRGETAVSSEVGSLCVSSRLAAYRRDPGRAGHLVSVSRNVRAGMDRPARDRSPDRIAGRFGDRRRWWGAAHAVIVPRLFGTHQWFGPGDPERVLRR